MSKIQWTGDNLHPPAIVIVDLGNNYLKVIAYVIINNKIKFVEFSMPHGYQVLTDNQWLEEKTKSNNSRARGSMSHTFKIKTSDGMQALSIGKAAYGNVNNNPLLGSNKYIESGIDALLVACLCELFPLDQYPKGHNNLIIGYGYPPTEWQQTESIDKLLNKTHRIEDLQGNKRAFRVRACVGWEENIGALVHAMSFEGRNPDTGQFNKRNFEPNDRIIVFDSGGWLGSMGWAYMDDNGFPVMDYGNTIVSIDGGAYTVRSELVTALKRNPMFAGARDKDFTQTVLDDALKSGQMVVSGDKDNPIPIYDAIESSLSYINTVKTTYRNQFASGRFAEHILLTGGTSDPLYSYLVKAFDHSSIHLAGKRDKIYMANGYGAMSIVLDRLVADDLLPDVYLKAMEK